MFDEGILRAIAENKIQEAMKAGLFDNLPGRGRPLVLEDLSGMPPEMRLGYLLLKNANVLPEEMQVRKELLSLREMLEACGDEEARVRVRRQIDRTQLKYRMLMEGNARSRTAGS